MMRNITVTGSEVDESIVPDSAVGAPSAKP